jgi:hypothetical protein
MTITTNNPKLAGQQAGPKAYFGEHRRFAVYPVHTRFDAVSWFVADAELIDEATGFASIIRQEATKEAAMDGLLAEDQFEQSGATFIPQWSGVHPSTVALWDGHEVVANGFQALNRRVTEIARA